MDIFMIARKIVAVTVHGIIPYHQAYCLSLIEMMDWQGWNMTL